MKLKNLLPLVLLTIITWVFALRKNPFEHTISKIGSQFTFQVDFIIWGILTGLFLTIYILDLYKRANFHSTLSVRWLIVGIISLVIAVFLPALEQLPVSRLFHNLLAGLFGLSLIISLYIFIKFTEEIDETTYKKARRYLAMVLAGTVLCVVFFGITGIFEIYFITGVGMLLYFIGKSLPLS